MTILFLLTAGIPWLRGGGSTTAENWTKERKFDRQPSHLVVGTGKC
jgi:hypothetical protein